MINVLASIKVAKGKRAEFIAAFKDNLAAVHAENGCIEYFPAVDVDAGMTAQVSDPNIVTIIEKWENLEALQAHSVASHMLAYRERVKDIVENTTLKIVEAV